jgi:hypothetical protein
LTIIGTAGRLAIAESPVVDEYRAKAAFAYSFAKFIEWPHTRRNGGRETFRLGILGTDPFGEAIDDVVGGKNIRGTPVEIVRGRRMSDIGNCDVLFIAGSEAARLRQHLTELSGLPVLTVSDVPGFVHRGGMIGLCLEDDRVCFEVNRAALGQAGLAVSSRLLALARDVVGAATDPAGSSGEAP